MLAFSPTSFHHSCSHVDSLHGSLKIIGVEVRPLLVIEHELTVSMYSPFGAAFLAAGLDILLQKYMTDTIGGNREIRGTGLACY